MTIETNRKLAESIAELTTLIDACHQVAPFPACGRFIETLRARRASFSEELGFEWGKAWVYLSVKFGDELVASLTDEQREVAYDIFHRDGAWTELPLGRLEEVFSKLCGKDLEFDQICADARNVVVENGQKWASWA